MSDVYSYSIHGPGKCNATPDRRLPRMAVAVVFLVVAALLPAGWSGERPGFAPPKTEQLPTALIELDGSASENPDGGLMAYEWSQIDGPRVELSDPAAAKPYFRTGKPGLYRFQLIVTSNGLRSEPFIVEIMIERDNQPPIAMAPEEVWGEVGKPLEIDARESYDPESDQLTYRWRLLNRGLEIPPDALNHPVLSFVPQQDGVYELELVVADGRTASRPHVTRLNIKPRPRPPVARAKAIPREIPSAPVPEQAMAPPAGSQPVARIEGPSVAKLGDRVMLDARGSRGSSGRRLEYLWRQKSGPFVKDFEIVFDGAAERFQPPRAGDYEFELVVSDGTLESVAAVHKIKVVNETDPPVAVVVAPTRAMPGAIVRMDATQSYDLEGSPLDYHWRQTGGPRVTRYLVDEKLGDAAPAFYPPGPGIYSFELVVSNGRLKSRPIEIDIEVGNAKRPPALSILGPEVARTGERLVLSARVENADGRNISFAWKQSEGPAPAMAGGEGPRAEVTPPAPGRYIIEVVALEEGKVVTSARRTLEVFTQSGGQGAASAFSPPPTAPAPALTPPALSVPPLPPAPAPAGAPSGVANAPQLKSLVDMPAALSPVQTPQPTPKPEAQNAGATPPRAAAQIHPSTLGGPYKFDESLLVEPLAPISTTP